MSGATGVDCTVSVALARTSPVTLRSYSTMRSGPPPTGRAKLMGARKAPAALRRSGHRDAPRTHQNIPAVDDGVVERAASGEACRAPTDGYGARHRRAITRFLDYDALRRDYQREARRGDNARAVGFLVSDNNGDGIALGRRREADSDAEEGRPAIGSRDRGRTLLEAPPVARQHAVREPSANRQTGGLAFNRDLAIAERALSGALDRNHLRARDKEA